MHESGHDAPRRGGSRIGLQRFREEGNSVNSGGLTRRHLLLATTAGSIGLAGCLTDSDSGGPAENDDDGSPNRSGNGSPDDPSDGPGADTVPFKGDPDAAVTLEVYEDFGCPHCAQYNELVVPDIEESYLADGAIRYEHRDFVVTGSSAQQAANAAREVLARHSVDDFWAFATGIFSNQRRLAEGPDFFADLGGSLGLDGTALADAARDQAHQDIVDADYSRGSDFGVSATPSFVIDGELVDTTGDETWGDIADSITSRLDSALEDA